MPLFQQALKAQLKYLYKWLMNCTKAFWTLGKICGYSELANKDVYASCGADGFSPIVPGMSLKYSALYIHLWIQPMAISSLSRTGVKTLALDQENGENKAKLLTTWTENTRMATQVLLLCRSNYLNQEWMANFHLAQEIFI